MKNTKKTVEFEVLTAVLSAFLIMGGAQIAMAQEESSGKERSTGTESRQAPSDSEQIANELIGKVKKAMNQVKKSRLEHIQRLTPSQTKKARAKLRNKCYKDLFMIGSKIQNEKKQGVLMDRRYKKKKVSQIAAVLSRLTAKNGGNNSKIEGVEVPVAPKTLYEGVEGAEEALAENETLPDSETLIEDAQDAAQGGDFAPAP